MYLQTLGYQPSVMEIELLHPTQLLLCPQGQCGVKNMHLTLRLVDHILLKLCRHRDRNLRGCMLKCHACG